MLADHFKINVTLTFNETNKALLLAAEQAYREILGPRWQEVFAVTGGLEGAHASTSKHYYGCGLDFRTGHDRTPPLMTRELAVKIAARMQELLGAGFFVQIEDGAPDVPDGHLHAQALLTLPVPATKWAA